MQPLKRYLLVSLGSLCVGLGVLGVFLPVLPTTPFLLLAAACYGRASGPFYHWLLSRPHLGRYIRDYREGRGVALRHKVIALTTLWLTIAASVLWAVRSLPLRLLLVAIAAGVTVHLLRLPTRREDG